MNLRSFWAVCALFALMCAPTLLAARHIIGGDITYVCLGNDGPNTKRYRFTMKIYRDCDGNGAQLDNAAEIAIYRGSYTSNSFYQNFNTPLLSSVRLIPDTPQCVQNVPDVCVQEGIYEFERSLPISTNQSYFIVYQRCCRNQSITNIVNPGDIGATYMVEITPEAQTLCNNSPVFKNFPPIIICNNFPLEFDHSALDSDGDLLVYSFCSPFAGGGPIVQQPDLFSCFGAKPTPPCAPPFDNVPFAVPTYTPGNPMGGSPQITINPVTGFISGTPHLLGQFVVGVCVQEYRNGQLLSTVKREFQFNVTNCTPNVFASISTDSITVPSPKQFVVKSCGEYDVFFENLSGLRSKIDYFRWEFNINGVPIVDTDNWSTAVTFPDTGTYHGKLSLNPGNPCGDSAFITVRVFPEVKADFTFDYDTCVAGPVVFTDHSSGEGIVSQWKWNFGIPGTGSTEQNPTFLYPFPGNHPVNLRATDGNQCSDDTTQIVQWYPVPPLIIVEPSSYLGCAPATIIFNNLSTPIDSTYDIVWDFGDGRDTSGVISPGHLYTEEGVYDVRVAITSPIGCFIADSFQNLIRVKPSPVAAFDHDPDSLLSNFNRTVRFIDQSTGANRWNWQLGRFETTTEQNPVYTFPDTGIVTVRLIVTHPEGCRDSVSKVLDIRPEVRWFMPNAFTPNGDSANDGFLGKGSLEGVDDFRMTIWNRWGELVFETSDPSAAWNGRQRNTGGMSPAGVYVYLVKFTGPRGEPFEFKGFATLIL
jgi:gliding motility-associated-like protein